MPPVSLRYGALIWCVALCASCDSGTSAVARSGLDAGRDVSQPDIGRMQPTKMPGELCEEGQCRRGACVHGVCSPLCSRDEDCGDVDLRCLVRENSRRCSRVCRQNTDCVDGLICAVSAPDLGFCVAPGEGSGGASCQTRSDCNSWRCSRGQCLASCDSEPCEAGFGCLGLHTQQICTPIGPIALGDQCQFDRQCETGICRGGQCVPPCREGTCPDDRVCVRYASLDLCERRCATSDDCGEDAFCLLSGRQKICTTRGSAAAGEVCNRHDDCASGRCDQDRCAARCVDDACEAGYACISDVTGSLCRPAGPAPNGSRCQQSDVCASGFCSAGQCAPDCENEGDCPPSFRCTQFSNGRFCFAPCEVSEDCSPVAFCDPDFSEGPTCYWRGAGRPQDSCTSHRDCVSGYCDGRECRRSCADDGDCAGQARCVSVGTTNICTTLPLPMNAACERTEACAPGTRCTAGRCLPDCETSCPGTTSCYDGLCRPNCELNTDCRPGRACITNTNSPPFCADPGAMPAGSDCINSAQCNSLLCLEGRCAETCGACSAEESCLVTTNGSWCVRTGPLVDGAPCSSNSRCESGLCLGARCSRACDSTECPIAMRCGVFLGSRRCEGHCDPSAANCPEGEDCTTWDGQTYQCLQLDSPTRDLACAQSSDCGPDAPICQQGSDGLRCRAYCDPLAVRPCGVDQTCVISDSSRPGLCLPSGNIELLGACLESARCADGWCVEGYLSGRCGRPCLSDEACDDGYCIDLARDPSNPLWTCATSCEDGGDCARPLECRRRLDGTSACY